MTKETMHAAAETMPRIKPTSDSLCRKNIKFEAMDSALITTARNSAGTANAEVATGAE